MSESRADRDRRNSAEIDEANRHGYVKAAELNGTHVGKGLWDFDDAEWREIVMVSHTGAGALVITREIGKDTASTAREHRSTEQSFDVTAHPMRDSQSTEQATPDLPTTEGVKP